MKDSNCYQQRVEMTRDTVLKKLMKPWIRSLYTLAGTTALIQCTIIIMNLDWVWYIHPL